MRMAITLLVVLIASANITNSVLLRWGFKDRQPIERYTNSFSLVGMMDGTAPRPFVFRAQIAMALKQLAMALPQEKVERLHRSITRYDSLRSAYFPGIPDKHWTPITSLTYHLMYLLVTLSVMGALWLIHCIGLQQGLSWSRALGLTVAFSFVYPLTFQQGAFYYDFFELLAAMALVHGWWAGRFWQVGLAVALGSINKETFFFLIAALWWLAPTQPHRHRRWTWLAPMLLVSLYARSVITETGTVGPTVEQHLSANLGFWINPLSWLSFDNITAKGVLTPSIQNPLMLTPLMTLLITGWKNSPGPVRSHAAAIMAILLPLFLAFGYKDEFRALALAFPALVMLGAHATQKFACLIDDPNPHSGPSSTQVHTSID